jgi:RimJ/RimL family protein N-acetyltransferase
MADTIQFLNQTQKTRLIMTLILKTPRLTLRPFTEDDIPAFSRYRSDPLVAQYQGWEAPFSMEQAARFVEYMKAATPGKPGQWYQIAFERKADGKLIGDCVFKILEGDTHQAEIGFTLARDYQGQGYASEGVGRLLQYLFEDLNLNRVRANCDPQNAASIRLMKRLGMRHEGRWIKSLWYKGAWADEDWFAILQEEWQSRQNNLPL